MLKSSFFIARCLLIAVLMACSVKAIHFNCRFGVRFPWNLGTRYTCDARVINSGSTSLERVTGDHQFWKSNDDVGCLYIWNQNLTSFPEGIADFFKNLDALWIQSSSLTSLSANDLRPFPQLVFLELNRNQLTSLDGDMFKYTSHLQYVSFSGNQIQHIGYDLVTNLNDLTYLNFVSNVCIDWTYPGRAHILALAPQLSVLCPPLDGTTTSTTSTTTTRPSTTTTTRPTTTTTRPKTTEINLDQCLCDEEIEELHDLNRASVIRVDSQNRINERQSADIKNQNREIKQLQYSIERLSEENQQQNRKIEQQCEEIKQLQESRIQETALFERRLLEVEMKLREIGSMPWSS